MYEWAITGMWAVIVSAVFPIYYQGVLAAGQEATVALRNFSYATTLGIVGIGVTAPLLGAITDRAPLKKRLLALFAGLGISGAALLFFATEGQALLGLTLFVVVNIGANGSVVFYDALLPHLASSDEVDRVSTGAFAVGYLGAGLLLAACLWVIQMPTLFGLPEGTLAVRLSFVAVAVWWAVFSIPLLLRVPEPTPEGLPGEVVGTRLLSFALSRIQSTFRELRSYRNAFLLLLAYLVYGDGIGTIIRMASIYGAELGIGRGHMIGAIVLVQFVGVPFSFLFGSLAGRVGTKRAIFLGIAVYGFVTLVAFFMTSALHFWILAFLVGTVQGGTQALSRSLFASMIPAYKSGELFGFYGVMDKFSGMFGPLVMGLVAAQSGSSRLGILSVLLFFVGGAILLWFVDEEEGRAVARAAQDQARPLKVRKV